MLLKNLFHPLYESTQNNNSRSPRNAKSNLKYETKKAHLLKNGKLWGSAFGSDPKNNPFDVFS